MTAEEIRKLIADRLEGKIDGSLDADNTRNLFLAEIAAQLAEMNTKPTYPEIEIILRSLAECREIRIKEITFRKKIEALAMRTCNTELDLAITLESIRKVFSDK